LEIIRPIDSPGPNPRVPDNRSLISDLEVELREIDEALADLGSSDD
jgi:hypothetical protein